MWWADFQARAHWEDDVWAKSLGEQAGSSIGFCAKDTTQGPHVVGQPMSGIFMEPTGGCCAYGEVEFEQQVVNNWDEVKESELACGRPSCSMRWLYLFFRMIWVTAEVGAYPSTLLTDGEVWQQQPLLFGGICVATTPELLHDLTLEPRELS